MTEILPISLLPYQLPAPPVDGDVRAARVRWLVMVMNTHPHDAQIGFIASPLHAAVKNTGLTATLAAAANVIIQPPVVYYDELHCLTPWHSPLKEIGFRPWLADDNKKDGA